MRLRLFNLIGSISLGLAACSPITPSPTSVPISTLPSAYPAPTSISTPLPAYPAPTVTATNPPLPTLPAGVDVSQFQKLVRWGEGPLQFISLSPSAAQYLVATPQELWITQTALPEVRIDLKAENTSCQEVQLSNSTMLWSKDESQIAIGYFSGICIWNTASGFLSTQIQGEGGVSSLAWSPDGKYIVWSGLLAQFGLQA